MAASWCRSDRAKWPPPSTGLGASACTCAHLPAPASDFSFADHPRQSGAVIEQRPGCRLWRRLPRVACVATSRCHSSPAGRHKRLPPNQDRRGKPGGVWLGVGLVTAGMVFSWCGMFLVCPYTSNRSILGTKILEYLSECVPRTVSPGMCPPECVPRTVSPGSCPPDCVPGTRRTPCWFYPRKGPKRGRVVAQPGVTDPKPEGAAGWKPRR
jgi:hypothetical protein